MKNKKNISSFVWVILIMCFFALIFNGCARVTDKCIFDDLKRENLSKAIKKDPNFGSFYLSVQEKYNTLNDVQKARYHDLTYDKLYNYQNFFEEDNFWAKEFTKWESEWKKLFEKNMVTAQELLKKNGELYETNPLGKYASIEFSSFGTRTERRERQEQYGWWSYRTVYYDETINVVRFQVTPTDGGISDLVFEFGIKPKDDEKSSWSYFNFRSNPSNSTSFQVQRDVSSTRSGLRSFYTSSKDDFLTKNDHIFVITSLKTGGQTVSIEEYIPKVVLNAIDDPSEENMTKLIVELINKDYVTMSDFFVRKYVETAQKRDKLAYQFLTDSEFQRKSDIEGIPSIALNSFWYFSSKYQLISYIIKNKIDLKTPSASLRYFFNICKTGDQKAVSAFLGNELSFDIAEMFEGFKGIDSIDERINGDTATLNVKYGNGASKRIVMNKRHDRWWIEDDLIGFLVFFHAVPLGEFNF